MRGVDQLRALQPPLSSRPGHSAPASRSSNLPPHWHHQVPGNKRHVPHPTRIIPGRRTRCASVGCGRCMEIAMRSCFTTRRRARVVCGADAWRGFSLAVVMATAPFRRSADTPGRLESGVGWLGRAPPPLGSNVSGGRRGERASGWAAPTFRRHGAIVGVVPGETTQLRVAEVHQLTVLHIAKVRWVGEHSIEAVRGQFALCRAPASDGRTASSALQFSPIRSPVIGTRTLREPTRRTS